MKKQIVLAENLRKLREYKDWDNRHISKQISVPVELLDTYEQGIVYPSLEILFRFADLYSVGLDFLVYGY